MDIISRQAALAQGLTRYFTGKPCKHGHVSERTTKRRACLACEALKAAEWAQQNKVRVAASAKARRERNKERTAAVAKTWVKNNPELVAAAKKRWYEKNKKRAIVKSVQYQRQRLHSDPSYRFAHYLRTRQRRALKSIAAGKTSSFCQLLGCSWNHAFEYMESRFQVGMSWDNQGSWHVDHVRPCASFDLNDPRHQAVCCNWRNLQPLWGADNIRKNDAWTPAMEAEWAQAMRALGWEGELFLVFAHKLAA